MDNQRPQRQPRPNNQQQHNEPKEFEEKVISVARVSKKTKGGNKMGFSVLIVVGDRKGRVGLGLGKAKDVVGAIRKGVRRAKKRMLEVPMDGTTIPFRVDIKTGAGKVMLKPAPKGSGVIAGGPVRAVVEAAGIRDISSKILGSTNQSSSVYATFEALKKIRQIVDIKGVKLRSIADIEKEEKMKEKELTQAKAAPVTEKTAAPATEEPKITKDPVGKVVKKVVKTTPTKQTAKRPVGKAVAKKK